jgi:hypothetical protein
MSILSYESNPKNLRSFGITLSAGFLVIGMLFLMLKGKFFAPLFGISAAAVTLAVLVPVALKPVYPLWMGLAFIMAWINTRIILCLMLYLVITPVSLIMRLFGADLLDMKFTKKPTYWIKKEALPFKKEDYEKRF